MEPHVLTAHVLVEHVRSYDENLTFIFWNP